MQIQKLVAALAGMAAVADASVTFLDSPLSAALAKRQNRGGNNNNNNNNGGNNNQLCLNQAAVQTGSQQAGKPSAQQANSATDKANFINFCNGQTLTNGEQKTGGSCNGIVMGKIPAQAKMVSTIIQNPPHNGNIQANKDFDVQLKVNNLQAGSFTDAQSTYYSAPQNLNGAGQIIGHVHVTVQDMGGSLTPGNALDPTKFVFFKGINDAGDGNGNLKATVTGGLPAGNYRVCTMSSASNHQPVLMPVAQRGAQDDCNKFTVGGNGGGNNGGNNGANNNQQNNGQQNNGQQTLTESLDNQQQNNGQNQNQGQNQGNRGGKQNGGGQGGRGGFPGQFPQPSGSATPGSATSQPQTGNANTAGQGGDAASNSGASKQGGGTSGNSNTGSGQNANGNPGSGKGGATSNAIGGVAAPAVTNSGDSSRPFSVNGNSFVSKASAVQRACDIQRNGCLNAFNGGRLNGGTIADCDAQVQACTQELS
ncbi:uncharacterized protein ColSpa_06167 [Colletotrichum spaethianum]|uniref:Ribosomal protein s17 n=1 Tax=Colletotrichum spaethianum TaxID=700344 RepID=A0AA37LC89_9PEZI|nr:uncharacterized protein ColSpa_06167 [Colletotrichum spaethianum]GKT45986.1 hypothetical protein ColSpa_06167 [Colletotrichum spaethianum]